MTQKFTITKKRYMDKALYNLLSTNDLRTALVSFKLSKGVILDTRAYNAADGKSYVSLLFTFNLKAYESEKEILAELESCIDLNPTTSYEVLTRFFSYLENDEMKVYEVHENQSFIKTKIITSWQNLTKSQSESPEVASASKSVS